MAEKPDPSVSERMAPQGQVQEGDNPARATSSKTISQNGYKCAECGKIFVRKEHYIRHARKHQDEPSLVYECPICQRQLTRSDHMRYHLRSHSNKKPFGCQECGKKYRQMYSLQRHMKQTGHQGIVEEEEHMDIASLRRHHNGKKDVPAPLVTSMSGNPVVNGLNSSQPQLALAMLQSALGTPSSGVQLSPEMTNQLVTIGTMALLHNLANSGAQASQQGIQSPGLSLPVSLSNLLSASQSQPTPDGAPSAKQPKVCQEDSVINTAQTLLSLSSGPSSDSSPPPASSSMSSATHSSAPSATTQSSGPTFTLVPTPVTSTSQVQQQSASLAATVAGTMTSSPYADLQLSRTKEAFSNTDAHTRMPRTDAVSPAVHTNVTAPIAQMTGDTLTSSSTTSHSTSTLHTSMSQPVGSLNTSQGQHSSTFPGVRYQRSFASNGASTSVHTRPQGHGGQQTFQAQMPQVHYASMQAANSVQTTSPSVSKLM